MSAVFGEPRPTSYINEAGQELRADESDSPFEPRPDAWRVLPEELVRGLDILRYLIGASAGSWHRQLPNGATAMLVNHFTNDVLILVETVLKGDGRSAARTARALYEALVMFAEVQSSAVSAQRYEQHQWVTQTQLAERRAGLDLMDRPSARRESKRLTRLRQKAARPLAQALATYGNGYRAKWHPGSLFDMAKQHGYVDGYEAYRILSGVMHTSSGSLTGTTRPTGGNVVYRTGLDLELAAMAYLEGLRWVRLMLDLLPEATGTAPAAADLKSATDTLISAYPVVLTKFRKLDNQTWPRVNPPQPAAVLAIYPTGERWYYWDPAAGTVTVADPPDETSLAKLPLDRVRAAYATYNRARFYDRPMTTVCLNVVVRPRPGSRPVSARTILVDTALMQSVSAASRTERVAGNQTD